MSVLIKGLEMPTACSKCDCGNGDYGFCQITRDSWWHINPSTDRMENCPLVPIPDHGDLIDRSMLIGGFADWYIQESPMYLGDSKVVAETIGDAMKAIEAAPVVIPAERSEDGES